MIITFRKQLTFSLGLLCLLTVGIAALSLWYVDLLSSYTAKLYRHPYTVTANINAVDADLAKMHGVVLNSIVAGETTVPAALKTLQELDKDITDRIVLVKERFLGDKQWVASMHTNFEAWTRDRNQVMAFLEKGDRDQAASVLGSAYKDKFAATTTECAKIRKFAEDKAGSFFGLTQSEREKALWVVIAAGGLAVALSVLVGWLIVRTVFRKLGAEPDYATRIAREIAAGNLMVEVEVKPNDTSSLVHAMRSMRDSLSKIVNEVRDATGAISGASQQIAAGNADLSQRTEQQASSLEETASSMEELTGTVKQNADNARQANQLAAGASTMAVKGGEVVGQVVHSMSSINESSRKIADIIGVIDGIAFQTNILALNAAVEAARAGEQGRGFAVVASEVRTLAQRSAAAAKEIKALITDSVGKVEDGSRLVDQAGQTMEEIVTSVKRVTDIMAEIAAASQEQTSGIEQVNQAITQMDQVTQQNAALVEEAAAAAESMKEQAHNLTRAVAIFKLSSTEAASRVPQHEESSLAAPEARAAAPEPADSQGERRGPNRAKNVARLPKPEPKPATQSKAAKVANGDDNWQEF